MSDKSGPIAYDTDWWDAGWERILPRQAFWLHLVVVSATVRDLDGTIDELVQKSLGEDGFARHAGGLDSPVWWSYPDDDNDTEQVEIDHQRKEEFERALSRAGRQPPRTVRELADLMALLGVFDHDRLPGDERWRSPSPLPLVAERLFLVSREVKEEEDQLRWRSLHESSAQALIRLFMPWSEAVDEIRASLEDLAARSGLDVEDVRFAIAALIDDGDFRLLDESGTDDREPESIPPSHHVVLRVDWDLFREGRIGLIVDGQGDEDVAPE